MFLLLMIDSYGLYSDERFKLKIKANLPETRKEILKVQFVFLIHNYIKT